MIGDWPHAPAQPILIAGDPRLLQRSREIEGLDDALLGAAAGLIATLREFREKNGFGRALSAPQVGFMRRLIAMNLGAGPFVLINPELTWRSAETFLLWDDCLSVPEVVVRGRRHVSISLTYRDDRFRLRRWNRLPSDMAELVKASPQFECGPLSAALRAEATLKVETTNPIRSFTGALGIAALIAHRERFASRRVATILCGGNRPAP